MLAIGGDLGEQCLATAVAELVKQVQPAAVLLASTQEGKEIAGRLAVKLDFIAGCAMKAVEMTGTSAFRGVQAQIGEILNWRDLFWGLSDAMAKSPEPWVGDSVQPNGRFGMAYRTFMGVGYPRIKLFLISFLLFVVPFLVIDCGFLILEGKF